MLRWKTRVYGCLVLVGALVGMAGPAWACWNCSVWGCVASYDGFNFCRTVVVFGQPACFASGLCPPWPFGSGGAPDAFPKIRRPIIADDPAAEIERGELTTFALTLPCRRGCGVFEPGQTSRLLRGAAAAGDALAMLGAVARTTTDLAPDLRVATAEVSVGPGEYRGAFAGKDGNGFGVGATRSMGGVALALCSIEVGAPGRALASETLGPDDLLLVRVWLEDRECLLAWSAVAAGLANERTPEEAAERRRAFLDESRSLTRRGRHPGFRLDALDPVASVCP